MKTTNVSILYVVLIVLSAYVSADVVHIPDPNLERVLREAMELQPGDDITTERIAELRTLNAPNQGIKQLVGIEHAVSLQDLRLPFNEISDLMPLASLTRLKRLYLYKTLVSDLSPLRGLIQLEDVDLSGCKISDISPLSDLKALVKLNLRVNRITDVRSLATLVNLEVLYVDKNLINDHTSLDDLSLVDFWYDQTCEFPPLPLEPRLENRSYPATFGAEWQFGLDSRIDLTYGGGYLGMGFRSDLKFAGRLDYGIQKRDELMAINPHMVFLLEIRYATDGISVYGEDWPYWLRDADGNIIINVIQDPSDPIGFIDFTQPGAQDMIVQKAIDVSKCGLFDGIVFDSWGEYVPLLPRHWYSLDAEELAKINEVQQQAKLNIVQRIRAATRPNFLIQVNSNRLTIPLTGPYINGLSMETGVPGWFFPDMEELYQKLLQIENTLLWAKKNLRKPHINGVAGASLFPEPADSPENLRWVRTLTTLILTHDDGYALYQALSERDWGFWYDFLDTDLGLPVGGTAQLYNEDIPGLFIREFTNGWAVYNRSGEAQEITLPGEAISVESGLTNTLHTLPNIDGGIYLKTTPVDTPGPDGSDIYIAEPIDAVPGAVLHLDASNNSGAIAHWVNLGTAGGRLLTPDRSDRRPRVEEGEIDIPLIGFSGRRQYFTATWSRQTFGGPVHTNPKLYLGDWTLEFLCKRNGNLFDLEHQFAGFQNSPREGLQGIRLWLPNDGRELELSVHADGFERPKRTLNIFLEENVWTWVTIASINGESIIAYQDGVEVSRHPGVYFDANLPLDDISIGSFSYDERHRNFNGSFSIVRVYDRALSPDEVLQNIGATVIPVTNPADVNGDGVVNILDLVAVAQSFGTDGLQGDVNGDGVVNVFDLVQVAGAIGGGGAAPPAHSLDPSIISAADVERWLTDAQGLGVGDANFQRGIRFLEGLLAALTPKETTLLPNYPNPFNPETWIPYRLARESEVVITIYDTKGRLVRRLALGYQEAGHYAERGKAAYWDGRNERGETVASGIYIYHIRAGDYAASRRMVIVK